MLDEIIGIAEKEEVDLVLVAGDIFDSFNPSHESQELLFRTLRKLSNNGHRPVIVISGNHDSNQLIEAPDPFTRDFSILMYSEYDSVTRMGLLESGIEITQADSGFVELKLPQFSHPVRIILAPYANELRLRTYLGEEDREQEFRELMKSKWSALANKYCDENGINLFIGHFFFMKEGGVPEKEPESEKPILHVGGTQALYTHSIPSQIQYAALGHLHRYQVLDGAKAPVVYASSPLSYSLSEAGQEKRVVIVEVEPNAEAQFKPHSLKEGKPLHRKRFSDLASTLSWLEENPNCFVEITYATDHSIDARTRKSIMKAHDGIVSLIPEISREGEDADHHLKVEDLQQDMTALFEKYYQSEKGISPHPELMEIFKEVLAQKSDS